MTTPSAFRRRKAPAGKRPQRLRLAIFGPQGSGKGTQAALLAKKYRLPAISTGALFRDHMRRKTVLGKRIRSRMDRGVYIDNTITNSVTDQRLQQSDAKRGFILDGYPRKKGQLEFLRRHYGLDAAIVIELPLPDIMKRLSGRISCPRGHIYHIKTKRPKHPGRCDIDGLALTTRSDESPTSIRQRLAMHHRYTKPVLDQLKVLKIPVITVDGRKSITGVHADIVRSLSKLR